MSTVVQDEAIRKALASTPRPPRASATSAALTFGWRGMLKVKHVPEQLLDVTITPVMFVLMFTYLFGGAVAGSTAAYLDYILPGILVMSVLFTTVYSGIALNTDLTKGVVDRFRSLPVWRPAPLVGALLGDSVRYVLAGTVILVLGLALLAGQRLPRLLGIVLAAGTMTLTLYSMHVIALAAELGPDRGTAALYWAHALWALVIGAVWRTTVGQGPLEWFTASIAKLGSAAVLASAPDRPTKR